MGLYQLGSSLTEPYSSPIRALYAARQSGTVGTNHSFFMTSTADKEVASPLVNGWSDEKSERGVRCGRASTPTRGGGAEGPDAALFRNQSFA